MTALLMILAAFCVLGPLVALHEFGHYFIARLCGVKVQTYSIGFGPKLFGWQSRRSGINYQIAAIPLGGYVKMLDERNEPVPDELKPVAFNNQHPLKKIAIVAAGPVMNFLIAIGLFWVLFLFPSEQLSTRIGKIVADSPAANSGLMVDDKIVAIDNKAIDSWQQIVYALTAKMGENTDIVVSVERAGQIQHESVAVSHFMQTVDDKRPKDPLGSLGVLPYQPHIAPVVGEVLADGPAALMGLKTGDRFVSINQHQVDDWFAVSQIIHQSPEIMLDTVIIRDGKTQSLKLMPKGVKTRDGVIGQLGIRPQMDKQPIPDKYLTTIHYTPTQALMQALQRTYDLSMMTVGAIGKMIAGVIGIDNLSGPLTIAEVSKTSFEMGFMQVLATAAMISLSLAVLNLLPIPILDGGHLLFYTYELIVGKPLAESFQMAALRLGALLLFCFMLLAIGNDIMRFFGQW
ncbi:RIP metalloprotease RseP [Moraxella sp. ZJ142]|uniref:RIP metalloprotease RseP n=1 Tax=Moraxella marmotae TaxID=3344520 RepID=UPI0035D48C62